jgi:2-polyprenyl-6-methoxyphenol hydroxylase-like FAD-dependent oxidoreductase
LAIELGQHGIDCVVLERRTERSPQPRAKLTNIRTMTLLRRWGIAEGVRDAAPLPPAFPSDIAFVTRLTGWELTRFPNALSTAVDRTKPFPEPAQQVPQDVLEEVLRVRAASFSGVRVTRGLELVEFRETPFGIDARARDLDGGGDRHVRAKFIVGCDGARSYVREQLGISMPGVDLAANVSAVLRAPDLWGLHDKPAAVHYWTLTPEAPGIMGPLDPKELWWFHLNDVPNNGRLTDDEVRQSFFAAVGRSFPCEVVANGPWIAERRIADQYRVGRAFLAGDAAHLHPPMGGYGMNMGVGDAVDLGWKLSAVLKGWGGDCLLDSYEAERRPIHHRVIEEAASNYANNSTRYQNPALEETGTAGDEWRKQVGEQVREEKAREFASIGVQLGYRYEGSPVIVGDGSPPTPNEVGSYIPTARPGHLAPHAWVSNEQCLYDLFGNDLTLLNFSPDQEAASPLIDASRRAGVPLTVVDLPRSPLRELYESDLVLVRPDQHVAWRGNSLDEPESVLDCVRGTRVVVRSRNRA